MMKKYLHRQPHGFTLIELLIVITIITALSVSVFVALNPVQRLKDARDARRTSDVDTILSAIHSSIVDNKGSLPSNMPAVNTETQLGTGASGCAFTGGGTGGCAVAATACADLMTGGQSLAKYIKSMPIDPTGGSTWTSSKTGYSVTIDSNGIVTIKACGTEGTANINASR